jgi:metal-sulfur cluster biosynthetic enzyme
VSLKTRVIAALDTVYDPELDEPITTLGFVGSCVVTEDGDVAVRIRLPTPQCAPNFAFLMASDARTAVGRVPGVGAVEVVLDDHFTGAEINHAVARGGGFGDAFPGETRGDLQALRTLFRRKALVGRQARICQALAADHDDATICAMRVDELPPTPEVQRCLQLRRELGLPHHSDAPALVAGDGSAIEPHQLRTWLRKARLITLSLESNGEICRALLAVRYPDQPQEVEVPA